MKINHEKDMYEMAEEKAFCPKCSKKMKCVQSQFWHPHIPSTKFTFSCPDHGYYEISVELKVKK